MSETYHDAGAEADLALGQALGLTLNGWPVLVCRSDGGVYAVINRCTHQDSPLHEGRIRRNTVSCPVHGARFNLATGQCLGAPYRPLKTFDVKLEDGRISVAVPDDPPGREHLPFAMPGG